MQIPAELLNLTNTEIAAQLGVSRQAVLYARRAQNGRCVKCGKAAAEGSQHCAKHQKQIRKYKRAQARELSGFKPWKKGGRGRPPKGNDAQTR